MDGSSRTLVVVLSMHRSGSSFTTSVLQSLGMSLGPFELLGAQAHNVHGHFEAMPILELSREVQVRVYGFPDELPQSPEMMSRLIESRGEWNETIEIPDDFVSRGRSILGTLIDSGEISGFKDPRTVLLWPFWRRVLGAFPEVRIAPIALLRSPHEIAMSLFTRRQGETAYRTSLDLAAVHFLRLRAILEEWPVPIPKVCFGSDRFGDDLSRAVEFCGLTWDPTKVERLFDGSSVHHVPAVVVHEAQELFNSILAAEPGSVAKEANQQTLQADAVMREDLFQQQLANSRGLAADLQRQLVRTVQQLSETGGLLQTTHDTLQNKHESLHTAYTDLAQTRELLGRTVGDLRRTEDDLRRTEGDLRRTEGDLRRTEGDLRRTEELLHRSERETHDSIVAHERTRDEVNNALARVVELQARVDRFEGHRVIAMALRVRRRLKRALQSIRTRTVAWDLRR